MREASLNELVTMTRIPRAVLLHEAVDGLLEKHRVIWSRSRYHGVPSRGIHRTTLKLSPHGVEESNSDSQQRWEDDGGAIPKGSGVRRAAPQSPRGASPRSGAPFPA
jgi:hypothetical protein